MVVCATCKGMGSSQVVAFLPRSDTEKDERSERAVAVLLNTSALTALQPWGGQIRFGIQGQGSQAVVTLLLSHNSE